MKRFILLLTTVFLAFSLIACDINIGKHSSSDKVVRNAIENSDLESLAVSSGNVRSPEAILEYAKQHPDLYELLSREDLAELMEETGLDVILEYLDRGFTDVEHPEYWLNASALGEMVRILCPELETSLHDKLYE